MRVAVDTWRRRVLIVEDHALMRSLVAEAFGARGFDATTAASAAEALTLAESGDPDLLVTDIDMARSEAVRRIWPFLRDRRIDAYDDLLRRYRD